MASAHFRFYKSFIKAFIKALPAPNRSRVRLPIGAGGKLLGDWQKRGDQKRKKKGGGAGLVQHCSAAYRALQSNTELQSIYRQY